MPKYVVIKKINLRHRGNVYRLGDIFEEADARTMASKIEQGIVAAATEQAKKLAAEAVKATEEAAAFATRAGSDEAVAEQEEAPKGKKGRVSLKASEDED